MANRKFTARLNEALEALLSDGTLRAFAPDRRSLYSPVFRHGKFVWAKIMDSDGVLLAYRKVHNDEGAAVSPESEILVGVVLQSEDATSQTKPNPIGKASITHIQNGVWITTDHKRKRIDKLVVGFVLPKGASPKDRGSFDTARRNVLNASDMMPDSVSIEVPRGICASELARRLAKVLRPVLVGRGRPRSVA